ncbi:MAG: hypothetical protein P8Q14_02320 [Vicingaceae bacterium]|nr:hypothetical protein [Vicingaceae bacterium]
MDNITLLFLFLLDIVIAFLIAKYQQNNGYTFYKSFVGALIGMIGLTLLAIKGWNAL